MNGGMQWLGAVMGLSVCACTAWAVEGGGDAPPAPAVEAADPADAATKIELKVRPTSVNIDRSIQFDEDGQPRHEQERMSIQFQCTYPQDVNPLSYELMEVKAITSTGQKLESQNHRSRSSISRHNQQRAFSMYCSLPGNVGDADEIAELTGQLKLELGEGPIRRAVLGPYKDLKGKSIKIAELPNLVITVAAEEEAGQDPRVRVGLNGSDLNLLHETKFHTANGLEIDSRGWGGSSGDNYSQRSYRVNLPDDGQVVLSFWTSKRTVDVPFRVTDIPMPGATRDPNRPDLVFHFQPIGDAGAAVPLQGDLQVIVE